MKTRWSLRKYKAATRAVTPVPKIAGKGAGLSGLKAAAMRRTPVTARNAEPNNCQVRTPKLATWQRNSTTE
jgi:hypothetical protein